MSEELNQAPKGVSSKQEALDALKWRMSKVEDDIQDLTSAQVFTMMRTYINVYIKNIAMLDKPKPRLSGWGLNDGV